MLTIGLPDHFDVLAGSLGRLDDGRISHTLLGVMLTRPHPLLRTQHHVRAAPSPLEVRPSITLPAQTRSNPYSLPGVRAHPLWRH